MVTLMVPLPCVVSSMAPLVDCLEALFQQMLSVYHLHHFTSCCLSFLSSSLDDDESVWLKLAWGSNSGHFVIAIVMVIISIIIILIIIIIVILINITIVQLQYSPQHLRNNRLPPPRARSPSVYLSIYLSIYSYYP